jgi:phage tail-like protein
MAINTIDDRGSIISDPLRAFRFKAQFTPVNNTAFDSRIATNTSGGFTGGFSAISGLSIATPAVGYREGGFNTTIHKVPGMTVFTPVTFQRGALWGNDQAITWMRGLFAASAGEGLNVDTTGRSDVTGQFRCNIKISVMDHPNADGINNDQRMAFILKNAWIAGLSYSDLNAGANEIMMETMTVEHEGLSVVYVNSNGTSKDAKGYKPAGL